MSPEPANAFDLIVIGAGVNGAAIARDAALRGLRVCLVEADDVASGTSAWSSRLVHGGTEPDPAAQWRAIPGRAGQ